MCSVYACIYVGERRAKRRIDKALRDSLIVHGSQYAHIERNRVADYAATLQVGVVSRDETFGDVAERWRCVAETSCDAVECSSIVASRAKSTVLGERVDELLHIRCKRRSRFEI